MKKFWIFFALVIASSLVKASDDDPYEWYVCVTVGKNQDSTGEKPLEMSLLSTDSLSREASEESGQDLENGERNDQTMQDELEEDPHLMIVDRGNRDNVVTEDLVDKISRSCLACIQERCVHYRSGWNRVFSHFSDCFRQFNRLR